MTLTFPKTLPISIIIPTLNEEVLLQDLLASLERVPGLEIVIADGGSTDKTLEIAKSFNVMVVESSRGRGIQQNTGAGAALQNTLLFLHCDTRLPGDFSRIISTVLNQPETVAGAFQLKINAKGTLYRLVEWGVNLRSRFVGLPYGDQAIFMSKKIFHEVGGFADLPLLEDLELIRRLKRLGKIGIAPAAVTTSARRWEQKGVLRTTLLNQFILSAYLCKASPARLERLYYDSGQEKRPGR